jgi:hypothetical protein
VSVEPDLVHGAWTRQSVAIGGGPPFETQHVVWIQSGTCYADVRIPFHPGADERCFTGRSGWDGDAYRWTHRFDLEIGAPSADDVGELTWNGDTLVERGMFPTADGAVAYEERWVRLPESRGPFLALEGDATCMVRSGSHVITVADQRPTGGEFAAAYRRLRDGAWATVLTIGPADRLPSPDDAPEGWQIVHRGRCA